MLLVFAFICFAILFVGWIVAPGLSDELPERSVEPSGVMPETGTAPA